jgi:hypothetical protein
MWTYNETRTTMDKQMMYDYNSMKSFWTKFYKDWAEDAKSYQEQVAEFWKDFFKQNKK